MKLFSIMETAFDNFDETVQTYLSKALGNIGTRYKNTEIFGIIINVVKSVMQNMLFYIEDALTEQNIYTATRKKSVFSLAKISGYEAYYGSAATGTVIGKLVANMANAATTDRIYIPNKTVILNNNAGVRYVILLPTDYYSIDLSKPLITHEFNVVQGYFTESTYTAEGLLLETIHISSSGMFDSNYVTVYVNGVEYYQAASLYDMGYYAHAYTISVGYDNSFDIMFGNGTYGQPLYEGQTILIRYLTHIGKLGNTSLTVEPDFTIETPATNDLGESIDANSFIKLSMNHRINGGTDSDTIDVVKNMVGYNSRSLVLVNENNFKLFFRRFSFIDYMHIWGTNNTMTLCVSCLTNYKSNITNNTDYYNVDTDNIFLSEYQKNSILTCLNNSNSTFAGVSIKFFDPIIRNYSMVCYIKIQNEYDKDNVKYNIKNVVAQYFLSLSTGTTFIPKSDIINAVVNNDNRILSFEFNFISGLSEEAYKNGYYYKYKWQVLNNEYQYVPYKVLYEKDANAGLDDYGNISLDSDLEIPFLLGNFNYYTDKDNNNKSNSIKIEAIQFFFI